MGQGKGDRCLSGISEWVYVEYTRGRDSYEDISVKAVIEMRRKTLRTTNKAVLRHPLQENREDVPPSTLKKMAF